VIGVNRTGNGNGLAYIGGSTVFDPWGARISPTPVHATRIATIDTERVRQLRETHPFLHDRRPS
jgi:predicted amidohydrolase